MTHPKDFWTDQSRRISPDIDLRKEVALILQNHGHWGLLRRRVRDRKCRCWNDQTAEARSDCKTCLGSGWAFVDIPVRYRKTILIQSSENPTPAGRTGGGTLVKLYMKSYVKPDRGDFLAEIAQDETSLNRNFQIQPNTPLEITRMYDLQDVNDLREAGGRVEFFTAMAEEADLGDTT
jgi:hypothetical protein